MQLVPRFFLARVQVESISQHQRLHQRLYIENTNKCKAEDLKNLSLMLLIFSYNIS